MTILKPGDRVRVTASTRVAGHGAGAKGTVVLGPKPSTVGGLPYYIVSMDKDGIECTSVVFNEGEIEPDA